MPRKPTYDELARRLQELEAEVSELRRVEEALKHQKAHLELLIDSAPEAILLADNQHRITKINPQFVEMFHFSPEEAIGKRADELIARGEKQGEAGRITEEVGRGESVRFETVRYRKDGSPLHVELMAAPVWSGGQQIANYASYRDITEKKSLQAHLAHAQKMEAIGTLAGGIAHDFNNLLMGIQGRTSLMLLGANAGHAHYEHLKGIEEYVKSAAALTKQLLGFARGGKYEVKATDLNDLLGKSAEMFGRTRKEITIHCKFEAHLWSTEVDRGQVEQVFLNLFVNAWQSMPGGGDLFLETRNVHLEEKELRTQGLKGGRYVRVSVTDTGVGMDEKTRERIFEPFFTTKEMGRGTGLGLASAYGIIRNHGGRIGVISQPGAGATFHIDLPASSQAVEVEKAAPQPMPRGTETILLVDDEDMVLEVGEGMLLALGYKVLLARGGKEAVTQYGEKAEEVRLVILDMIMPRMGGAETFEALKKIRPGVEVLLSSGYSLDGQAEKILERGCKGFIQKPFDLYVLSRKLREILDRGDQGPRL